MAATKRQPSFALSVASAPPAPDPSQASTKAFRRRRTLRLDRRQGVGAQGANGFVERPLAIGGQPRAHPDQTLDERAFDRMSLSGPPQRLDRRAREAGVAVHGEAGEHMQEQRFAPLAEGRGHPGRDVGGKRRQNRIQRVVGREGVAFAGAHDVGERRLQAEGPRLLGRRPRRFEQVDEPGLQMVGHAPSRIAEDLGDQHQAGGVQPAGGDGVLEPRVGLRPDLARLRIAAIVVDRQLGHLANEVVEKRIVRVGRLGRDRLDPAQEFVEPRERIVLLLDRPHLGAQRVAQADERVLVEGIEDIEERRLLPARAAGLGSGRPARLRLPRRQSRAPSPVDCAEWTDCATHAIVSWRGGGVLPLDPWRAAMAFDIGPPRF
jgi:hypothetical protein